MAERALAILSFAAGCVLHSQAALHGAGDVRQCAAPNGTVKQCQPDGLSRDGPSKENLLLQFRVTSEHLAAVSKPETTQTHRSLDLVTLDNAKYPDALCLDGSPGAFYISTTQSSQHRNDWLIYLEGGGWCMTQNECMLRAQSTYGSSRHNKPTIEPAHHPGGIMSFNCTINPDFCNYNMVVVKYCDGTSYTGRLKEPLVYDCAHFWGADANVKCNSGTKIHFKGSWILDGVIQSLLEMDGGLADARHVAMTGCSAGGLGVILNTDRVHRMLLDGAPRMAKFGSIPFSGFFLDHTNLANREIYSAGIYTLSVLANSLLNERCTAAQKPDEGWRCFLAHVAYEYVEAPIFVLNSALDSWQTRNIMLSKYFRGTLTSTPMFAGWEWCAHNVSACNSTQLEDMNEYMDDFAHELTEPKTIRKLGNGAFINSCHWHCEAQHDDSWASFTVNGHTMQEAVSLWWKAAGTEPAEARTHIDNCRYGQDAVCNPTCTVAFR